MQLKRRWVYLTWEISDRADFLLLIDIGLVMANSVKTNMKNKKCFLLLTFVIFSVFLYFIMGITNVKLSGIFTYQRSCEKQETK